MNKHSVEQLIVRLESYLECWKQFNLFLAMARAKRFTPEDESRFLETKSVITQELEMILASINCGTVNREDIHSLISAAPSIRYLSEVNENAVRNIENQWHKLFISWQSILGQLKVRQQQHEGRSFFANLFRGRAA
jgi:CHAD domain-containing protein